MKNILVYSDDDAWGTFFLEGNKVLGYVHENDGNWRGEYFNPIFRELGLNIESKIPNKSQKEAIKKYCKDWNIL